MGIEECTVGRKVKIKASGKSRAKFNFAIIDAITEDMFTHQPRVIIRVLGEDKIVPPEVLICLKTLRKKGLKSSAGSKSRRGGPIQSAPAGLEGGWDADNWVP